MTYTVSSETLNPTQLNVCLFVSVFLLISFCVGPPSHTLCSSSRALVVAFRRSSPSVGEAAGLVRRQLTSSQDTRLSTDDKIDHARRPTPAQLHPGSFNPSPESDSLVKNLEKVKRLIFLWHLRFSLTTAAPLATIWCH